MHDRSQIGVYEGVSHTRNHSGFYKIQAPQNEVYFRRAAPGEGGARGEAVGGPSGNILFCGA